MTVVAFEGEYAVGYTKLACEFMRDRLDTIVGAADAYAWFVQGVQTLSPRWFVAARQEGSSAPPGIGPGRRPSMHISETTLGFRIGSGLTARGSYLSRKPFTRTSRDHQAGASLVWAQRWW
jgi:hypothetical protein